MFFHCVLDSNISNNRPPLQLVVVVDVIKITDRCVDDVYQIYQIYWPYTHFKACLDGQNTLSTIIEKDGKNEHIVRINAPPHGKPLRCSSQDLIEALNIYNDPYHYNGLYTTTCNTIQNYIRDVNDIIQQSIIQYCKENDITKYGACRRTISAALPEPLQHIITQKCLNMGKSIVEDTKKNSKRARRESPPSSPQLHQSSARKQAKTTTNGEIEQSSSEHTSYNQLLNNMDSVIAEEKDRINSLDQKIQEMQGEKSLILKRIDGLQQSRNIIVDLTST